jgi:hypothetical protein
VISKQKNASLGISINEVSFEGFDPPKKWSFKLCLGKGLRSKVERKIYGKIFLFLS